MEENYAIITDNGGGDNAVWHDVEGEEYTFPVTYQKILTEGTKVVYHRSAKKPDGPVIQDRLSDSSHYFGVAKIGAITTTPEGNLRAEIVDYERFRYPVGIHRPEGPYYEWNPFFQQGVRRATKDVYDDIVAASLIPPAPAAPKATKRKGIKSCQNLLILRQSNLFDNNKYKVVTGRDGYYIYNVADNLYYELEKPKPFFGGKTDLKVIASSSRRGYLIIHDGTNIGLVTPISNGVFYESRINTSLGTITINM